MHQECPSSQGWGREVGECIGREVTVWLCPHLVCREEDLRRAAGAWAEEVEPSAVLEVSAHVRGRAQEFRSGCVAGGSVVCISVTTCVDDAARAAPRAHLPAVLRTVPDVESSSSTTPPERATARRCGGPKRHDAVALLVSLHAHRGRCFAQQYEAAQQVGEGGQLAQR